MTLLLDSANGIAITRLTALAGGNLPVIHGTLMAMNTLDIGQARTLSGKAIAVSERFIGAQKIAIT